MAAKPAQPATKADFNLIADRVRRVFGRWVESRGRRLLLHERILEKHEVKLKHHETRISALESR